MVCYKGLRLASFFGHGNELLLRELFLASWASIRVWSRDYYV